MLGAQTRFPGLKVRGWHSLSCSFIQYGKMSSADHSQPQTCRNSRPRTAAWAKLSKLSRPYGTHFCHRSFADDAPFNVRSSAFSTCLAETGGCRLPRLRPGQ